MRFLREILTVIAGLVVLALLAALAGPWFVDWNRHRAFAEKSLSEALGAPVKIAGAIDLKLLPTPSLNLAQVRVSMASTGADPAFGGLSGQPPASIEISARRVKFELAIAPLLRGRLQFVEARIENPEVTIRPSASGAVALPRLTRVAPDLAAFDQIHIVNGRIAVEAAGGGVLTIGGLNIEASGQSLAGPFRGSGSFRLGDQTPSFFFNSGVADEQGLRFKFVSEAAGALPRIEIDGAVEARDRSGGAARLVLQGQARATPAVEAGAAPHWSAAGPLTIDNERVNFAPIEFRAGAGEQPLSGAASAQYGFAARRAVFSLDAPQIDLDRLSAAKLAPADALVQAQSWIASVIDGGLTGARLPVAAQLKISTPALTLGGETLGDVAINLEPDGANSARLLFSARAPGRTDIRFEGALETGSAAQLTGDLNVRARDLERFWQWFARGSPALAKVSGAIAFRDFGINGRVEFSRSGFLGRDLSIIADRSQFSGLVSLLRDSNAPRMRLAVHLQSQELDLDGLPDFSRSGAALNGIDLSLKLYARAMRLARFGGGKIDSGSIDIDLQRDGDRLSLNQLDIAGLGGADLSLKGEMQPSGSSFEGELRAQRLTEFAQLLQRIAPGVWSDALAARAVALSPANIRISAVAASAAASLSLHSLRSFALQGEANGTRLTGSFKPGAAAAQNRFELSAANPQAHVILRQAGVPAAAMTGGAGRASLVMTGEEAQAGFSFDGAALSFKGPVKKIFPAPDFDGAFTAGGKDIAPLMAALGLARPAAPRLQNSAMAASLEGRLRWRGENISLTALRGTVGHTRISGDLYMDRGNSSQGSGEIKGKLQADRLDLASLASLITGAPGSAPERAKEYWSRQTFAPALINLPVARIDMNVGKLALTGELEGDGARFVLHSAPSQLALHDLHTKLPGGVLRGRAELRRGAAEVSLAGAVNYEGPSGFGRAMSAHGTWRLEFAGTGASPAAIVSGLAGSGAADVKSLTFEAASASAVEDAIKRASEDKLEVTATSVMAHLEKALSRGAFAVKNGSFSIALAGGQARLEPSSDSGRVPLSGQIDLRVMRALARLDLRAPQTPADWKGPAPQISLVLEGKPEAPVRRIEAASLVNALAARAIERESLRVELLEIDIRERALFNRYGKIQEFMTRREDEIAVWRDAREREAAELIRKIEEAQRKAEEDARRKELEAARKLEIERKKRAAEEARRAKLEAQSRPAAQPPAVKPPAIQPPGAPLQLTPPLPAPPR